MPFKSEKQRRYLYANHPEVAERFAEETPKKQKLPKRARGKKKPGSKTKRRGKRDGK